MKKDNNTSENKKLNIAMIGHKRMPSREGGVEIVVEKLSLRLVELGHKVTVYNRKGHHVSGKKYNNGCQIKNYKGIRINTVPCIQRKGMAAVTSSFFATMKAIFGNYDCIHYHAEGPSVMLIIPHLLRIHTVVTIHGLDWQRAKWGGFATKYLKLGEKIAAKYADEVIVLSKNVQQYFIDTYNRETNFIPNGIEKPLNRELHIIKEKWDLEKDDYILFLARIVPEKGLNYLIDAFKEVNTSKKLVVAGGTSDTDAFMQMIKNKANADDRIIFTGFVQGQELEELYSNAYVYVLPSDLEGMPLSLLEAMSYGNCCIVSDIEECTEVVEDKAIVFKKSNVKDLKEKLNSLVSNIDLVLDYKQRSQEFILKKYNWNDIVSETIGLYDNTRFDYVDIEVNNYQDING